MTTVRIALRRSMLGAAVLAVLLLSVPASGQNAATDVVPSISFVPETLIPGGQIVYGSGTMLVRTRTAVYATIRTAGLTPGTVATAWLGAFNAPQFCATRPCTPADFANPAVRGSLLGIGGRVVGADGTADFAELRYIGDVTNAFIAGPGVEDPRRAEIHLAVRTHGPAAADPAVLAQQLSTFNGGCPPNACATLQFAPHTP